MFFRKETIKSFDIIVLSISGMRSIDVYEIKSENGKAAVSQYIDYFTDKNDRKLVRSASCSNEEMIELLNNCNIIKWDGFWGKNPRGVKDGYMFDFKAEVNNGREIRASGSNNYPKKYREFKSAIDALLYK